MCIVCSRTCSLSDPSETALQSVDNRPPVSYNENTNTAELEIRKSVQNKSSYVPLSMRVRVKIIGVKEESRYDICKLFEKTLLLNDAAEQRLHWVRGLISPH